MTTAALKQKIGLYEALVSLTLGLGIAGIVIVRDVFLWPFAPINRAVVPALPPGGGGLSLATAIAFAATGMAYGAFI